MNSYRCTTPAKPSLQAHGFTLIELLAVVAIISILAALAIPAWFSIQNKIYQTKCMSNLKRWSNAFSGYAADHNNHVRVYNWWRNSSGNPGEGTKYYAPYFSPDTAYIPWQNKTTSAHYFYSRCPQQIAKRDPSKTEGYFMVQPVVRTGVISYDKNSSMADTDGDGRGDSYNLIRVEKPSRLLVMMDKADDASGRDTYKYTDLDTFVKPACVNSDSAKVCHSGAVNALFSDGHIETIKWEQIEKMNAAERLEWFSLNKY